MAKDNENKIHCEDINQISQSEVYAAFLLLNVDFCGQNFDFTDFFFIPSD